MKKISVVATVVALVSITIGVIIYNQTQTFTNLNIQDNLGALAFGFNDEDIIDVDVKVETNRRTVRMTMGNPPKKAIIVEMSHETAELVFNKYKDSKEASTTYNSVVVYDVSNSDTTLIGTDSKFRSFGVNGFYFFISDNIKSEFGCMLALSEDCRDEVRRKIN